ncbi:MAG TPA: superoxide dismutase family protein [Lachnospiraceae bacterium]|nr:superoxide dismutase family protein [Lachnospiraceae bacterium]
MNNFPYTGLTPDAFAVIDGNGDNQKLHGTAYFYKTPFGGTLVEIEVDGLPVKNSKSQSSFLGIHIHENGDCTPPFNQTGEHYNPYAAPHPDHAGDMPPLLVNSGYAYSVFYTERFKIADINGRSVIIHDKADEFSTQPSGNSGAKIACGIIKINEAG